MALTHAYDTRTGEKVTVPEKWLKHPTFGKHLSKTPRTKAEEKKNTETPADGDTKKEK